MAKFDYMNFNDGSCDIEFVVNAKKFTKEQAIEFCLTENYWMFEDVGNRKSRLRKPETSDIVERTVKYYVNVPYTCSCESEGGCYSYCNEGARGSFKVWVIPFDKLKKEVDV